MSEEPLYSLFLMREVPLYSSGGYLRGDAVVRGDAEDVEVVVALDLALLCSHGQSDGQSDGPMGVFAPPSAFCKNV